MILEMKFKKKIFVNSRIGPRNVLNLGDSGFARAVGFGVLECFIFSLGPWTITDEPNCRLEIGFRFW